MGHPNLLRALFLILVCIKSSVNGSSLNFDEKLTAFPELVTTSPNHVKNSPLKRPMGFRSSRSSVNPYKTASLLRICYEHCQLDCYILDEDPKGRKNLDIFDEDEEVGESSVAPDWVEIQSVEECGEANTVDEWVLAESISPLNAGLLPNKKIFKFYDLLTGEKKSESTEYCEVEIFESARIFEIINEIKRVNRLADFDIKWEFFCKYGDIDGILRPSALFRDFYPKSDDESLDFHLTRSTMTSAVLIRVGKFEKPEPDRNVWWSKKSLDRCLHMQGIRFKFNEHEKFVPYPAWKITGDMLNGKKLVDAKGRGRYIFFATIDSAVTKRYKFLQILICHDYLVKRVLENLCEASSHDYKPPQKVQILMNGEIVDESEIFDRVFGVYVDFFYTLSNGILNVQVFEKKKANRMGM